MDTLHIIHADMDAFFAAIEQRDRPQLRGKAVVVGGDPRGRGVVSTASYEARKFGIHSAMPCRKAMELCPGAVFLPVDMDKYKRVSKEVFNIFYRYTPIIEPVSIDEAFLDVGCKNAVAIGNEIREAVKAELGLTVSVGVSYNKMMSKMASEMKKPDGFTVITRERALEMLPKLPIRKLWGVGEKTEKELNNIGIFTIGDLLDYDREFFLKEWGRRGFELLRLAQGIDESPVKTVHETKSIGEETTLPEDTVNMGILNSYLKEFALALAGKLTREGLRCRTLTLKIKYNDFRSITRSVTLGKATASSLKIYRVSRRILSSRVDLSRPVRLIGIQLSNLVARDAPEQLCFFEQGYQ